MRRGTGTDGGSLSPAIRPCPQPKKLLQDGDVLKFKQEAVNIMKTMSLQGFKRVYNLKNAS